LNNIRKRLGKIIHVLSVIGMAVTFFLMLITTIDVILRKVSDLSIIGSYEMTEVGMVVLIFFGIASLQVTKGHVSVDIFVNKFPRTFRHVLEVVILVIETAVMGLMTYCGVLKTISDYSRDLGTSVLRIPTWPFCALMTLGLFLFTVLLLIDAIIAAMLISRKEPDKQEDIPAVSAD
jgi:TRAP-type C4-dicarboxylate transport system permease small subunit